MSAVSLCATVPSQHEYVTNSVYSVHGDCIRRYTYSQLTSETTYSVDVLSRAPQLKLNVDSAHEYE